MDIWEQLAVDTSSRTRGTHQQ